MSNVRRRAWYSPSLNWCVAPGMLAVLALMFHTLLNTAMRIAGDPVEGSLEYGAFWYLPLLAFLGIVLAQRGKEQIEATLIFDRLTPAAKREFRIVGYVAVIIVAVAFARFGWTEAVHSMEVGRTAGASDVYIWPMMFMVPIGCVLLIVQLVIDTVAELRNPLTEDRYDAELDGHHFGEQAEL